MTLQSTMEDSLSRAGLELLYISVVSACIIPYSSFSRTCVSEERSAESGNSPLVSEIDKLLAR